ncbi:hypothetical protein SAMN05421770_101925 [Granulicella rosea]|uniref:Uncharacterized protein n=1 Tax=Granulicella rosea TaxID=474952 RepID=A0A239EFM2_9BACT|nr:hypothetical protein SAMN05421770_101925 [Granulicella rosea]
MPRSRIQRSRHHGRFIRRLHLRECEGRQVCSKDASRWLRRCRGRLHRHGGSSVANRSALPRPDVVTASTAGEVHSRGCTSRRRPSMQEASVTPGWASSRGRALRPSALTPPGSFLSPSAPMHVSKRPLRTCTTIRTRTACDRDRRCAVRSTEECADRRRRRQSHRPGGPPVRLLSDLPCKLESRRLHAFSTIFISIEVGKVLSRAISSSAT